MMATPQDYTVGWICALAVEFTAAVLLLDEEHEMPFSVTFEDNNKYKLGKIGGHNVIIASLPEGEYGIFSTASVARDMLRSFPNVRFGLMVGIGSGAPSPRHDIRLGDVVVGVARDGTSGVIQYDFGKTSEGVPTVIGSLNPPPSLLQTVVNRLKAEDELKGLRLNDSINSILEKNSRLRKMYQRPDLSSDRLYEPEYDHGNWELSCELGCGGESKLVLRKERTDGDESLVIHYGVVASSTRVLRNAVLRDKLTTDLNAVCFDIEAAGLMNHFPCLVIRGICDYADSHANSKWRGYAAMTAAAYTRELIHNLSPARVEAESKIRDILPRVTNAISEIKADVREVKRTLRREDIEILDWITPIDYSIQQSDYIQRCQVGTGQWALDSTEYHDWLDADGQALFCPGIPGAGKTILTSIVINNLYNRFHDNTTVAITYIYLDFRSPMQSVSNLLASLLKQLSQCQPSLPNAVKELFKRHQRSRTQPSPNEITATIQSVITGYSRVFIIVDALDECDVENGCRSMFLSELLALQAKYGVNIFVTSRPVEDISVKFKGATVLEVRTPSEDVRKYIEENISQLPSFVSENVDLQEEIKATLLKTSDGMFLRTQLQFQSLQDATSPKDIRKTLRRLSSGFELFKFYDEAMERIQRQQQDHGVLAQRVLSWIACAKRPIIAVELQHALAIKLDTCEIDTESLSDIQNMTSVCIGLITIDRGSDVIRFSHQTIHDYFKRTKGKWFASAEIDITMALVTYLSFTYFDSGFCHTDEDFEVRLQRSPFYMYASQNWGYHAQKALKYTTCSLVLDFVNSETKVAACAQAMMATGHNPGYSQKVARNIRGLHLAAYFGLGKLIKYLYKDGHAVNSKDTFGRTPLWWAAQKGHEEVVTWLLTVDGVDINCGDRKCGWTPLILAAQNGRVAVVKLLLVNGRAKVNYKDLKGRTPLWWAAHNGHVEVLKLLLVNDAIKRNIPDATYGWTPLLSAAQNGHTEVVQLLVGENGVDVGFKDFMRRTPLWWAALNGHTAIVQLLLEKEGIDVNSRDSAYGQTALLVAAQNGHESVVNLLLTTDMSDKTAQDSFGRTAFLLAAENRHEAVVKLILSDNCTLSSSKDAHGRTPLWWAAYHGMETTVSWLLSNKDIDPNVKDNTNWTPLLLAAARGHESVARLLLTRDNVGLNHKDNQGRTPLWWAADGGHETVVKLLLTEAVEKSYTQGEYQQALKHAAERGHEAVTKMLISMYNTAIDKGDILSGDDRMPLFWAVKIGHEAIVRILLSLDNIEPDFSGENNRTPLSFAAERGHKAIIKLLLENASVDPNSTDSDDRTSLSWAAEGGHVSVVKLLLAFQAVSVEYKDINGRTPFWWAASSGRVSVIKLLLAKDKVDPDSKDCVNRSPLSGTAEKGHAEVIKLLLDTNNVDPDSKDITSRTPLSWAAEGGREGVVRLLLATEKVNANHQDERGCTALFWAAERGHNSVATLLLEKGADITVRSKLGLTALHHAAKNGHRAVAELLIDKGSDVNLKGVNGTTPLYEALAEGYLEMVKLLVEAGDSVTLHALVQDGRKDLVKLLLEAAPGTNPLDLWNRSPIHTAVMSGHVDILENLLSQHSNIDIEDIDGVSPLYLAVLCRKVDCINLLLQNSASTRHITANHWRSVYKDAQKNIVMLTEGKQGRKVKLISEEIFENEMPTISLMGPVSERRLFLLPNNSAWEQGCLKIPLIIHQGIEFTEVSQLQIFRQIRIKDQWNPPSNFMKWDSSDFQAIAWPNIANIQSFRFTAAVSFPVGKIGNPGDTFEFDRSEWKIISWVIVPPSESKKERAWKTIECFSMLTDGSMHDSGEKYFIQFMSELEQQWFTICDIAEQHLTYSREYVLKKNGTSTTLISCLLKDAQKWTELRRLLRDHAQASAMFESKYKSYKEYSPRTNPVNKIINLEKVIGDKIRQLDYISQDLIQMEFNLVSIAEARRSTSTSTSMKRLSWITFIFLPLMFASSLFGMNVNVLKDSPDWRWYLLFGGSFLLLTLATWLIFKFNNIEKWVEDLTWRDTLGRVAQRTQGMRLTQRNRRKESQPELP